MRLAAFAGSWTIERTIEDACAGRAGRFTGEARFTSAAIGLAYRERGTLRLGDAQPLKAIRSYLWREGGAGTIAVLFEDGRLFHRFAADETRPEAVHDCPPDRYRVRYDFARWPRWQSEWRVQGTRKDYVLVSTFCPAGQGQADAA